MFGACVARALDRGWHELGDPDPFVVVEAGAGNGRLARDVLRARPDCVRALHYVLVERLGRAARRAARAARARAARRGAGAVRAGVARRRTDPGLGLGPGVRRARRAPGARAHRRRARQRAARQPAVRDRGMRAAAVGRRCGSRSRRPAGSPRCSCRPKPPTPRALDAVTDGLAVPAGARLPIPRGIDAWFAACGRVLRHGTADRDRLRRRRRAGSSNAAPTTGCARIAHTARGGSPLEAPGTQDITADVVREQLLHAARAAGLHARGGRVPGRVAATGSASTSLVEAGRRTWESARTHRRPRGRRRPEPRRRRRARSPIPTGLGAHRVVTLTRRGRRSIAWAWIACAVR